jgi:hypothetical protein
MIKTHYDIRAARILMARQTYMIRKMGEANGSLPSPGLPHRRASDVPDAAEALRL